MRLITLLLILLPISVIAQIDYPRGLELISAKNPSVQITWIRDASKEVPLYFNQQVSFVNTKTDTLLTSRVITTIRHNGRAVKSFEFKVGDGIVNHIYTSNPIKLNMGDSVTIHFELKPTSPDEQYVFNIFERKTSKPDVKYTSVTPVQKQTIVASAKQKSSGSNELKRMRRNRTIEGLIKFIAH
jgi:hypothetical protein